MSLCVFQLLYGGGGSTVNTIAGRRRGQCGLDCDQELDDRRCRYGDSLVSPMFRPDCPQMMTAVLCGSYLFCVSLCLSCLQMRYTRMLSRFCIAVSLAERGNGEFIFC